MQRYHHLEKALIEAIQANDFDAVKINCELIQRKHPDYQFDCHDKDNRNIMHLALDCEDESIPVYLYDIIKNNKNILLGKDKNGTSLLFGAATLDNSEMLKRLLESCQQATNPELISLINNLDNKKNTALHHAIISGANPDNIALLINHVANLKALNEEMISPFSLLVNTLIIDDAYLSPEKRERALKARIDYLLAIFQQLNKNKKEEILALYREKLIEDENNESLKKLYFQLCAKMNLKKLLQAKYEFDNTMEVRTGPDPTHRYSSTHLTTLPPLFVKKVQEIEKEHGYLEKTTSGISISSLNKKQALQGDLESIEKFIVKNNEIMANLANRPSKRNNRKTWLLAIGIFSSVMATVGLFLIVGSIFLPPSIPFLIMFAFGLFSFAGGICVALSSLITASRLPKTLPAKVNQNDFVDLSSLVKNIKENVLDKLEENQKNHPEQHTTHALTINNLKSILAELSFRETKLVAEVNQILTKLSTCLSTIKQHLTLSGNPFSHYEQKTNESPFLSKDKTITSSLRDVSFFPESTGEVSEKSPLLGDRSTLKMTKQ